MYIYIYVYIYIYIYIYMCVCIYSQVRSGEAREAARQARWTFCFSLTLSSRELSDTNVYAPYIRALFGTASPFGGSCATDT